MPTPVASGHRRAIDVHPHPGHHDRVDDDTPERGRPVDDELEEGLDPREAARDRRRDREAEAEQRALMRAGMGKVFKQILDNQARDAEEPTRAPGARRRPH